MQLPEGAQHVQEALRMMNSNIVVEMMPDTTATAKDAADAVGVEVAQIGKSIVFNCESIPIVAVLPGNRRVDANLLRSATSSDSLKKPNADWVFSSTGYRIGGVSPFALPEGVIVVVERELNQLPLFYVAAGHPRAVARVTYSELIKYSLGIEANISM